MLLLKEHLKDFNIIDNWYNDLWSNPNIFTYDYDAMRDKCLIFKEELIKNRFHPQNLSKFRDWRIDGFDSDSDGNGN